jgi:hypothetical protein
MRIFPIALVMLSTFLAGASWGAAQADRVEQVPPTVLSGSDVGFRIEGRKGSAPVGTLVIRVDGKWVEPEFAARLKLLTK